MASQSNHPQSFESAFRALDDKHRPPLKWQARLYERFVHGGTGAVPKVCRLPTGLGKTSVIPIWLIALAGGAALPRRLVYIVNRRTVVDQATEDAKRLLARLYRSGQHDRLAWATEEAINRLGLESEPSLHADHAPATRYLRTALDALCTGDPAKSGDTVPLAISTLRGELADNGEWKKNPARPAIIIGTIDMIGSKLLFSGYGDGRSGRAHHAGLIGQDALVVHDEAHLSPAFDVLLRIVAAEQAQCGEARPIRVISLSATTRTGSNGGMDAASLLGIEDEDRLEPVVSRRLRARKWLTIVDAVRDKSVAKIAEHALALGEAPARVLVYVRSPETAAKVTEAIKKELGESGPSRVATLTGTIRGKERDELARSEVFRAFKAGSDRSELPSDSLYLVSTSAGEVGVDLDADHMVCDLTTLDSMAQRFGRVNRLGGDDRSARIVVMWDEIPDKDPLAVERRKTAEILKDLPVIRGSHESVPEYDASPEALSALLATPEAQTAFAPMPKILPAMDILFDHWSLTSIAGEMPGRPEVGPYLHGVAEWEPPETHVAWRADIAHLAAAGGKDRHGKEQPCSRDDLEQVFNAFPLRSTEQLRDRTDRVQAELLEIAERLNVKTQHRKASPPMDNADSEESNKASSEDEVEGEVTEGKDRPIAPNPLVVLMRGGSFEWVRLDDIARTDKDDAKRAQRRLAFATVVLPVEVGGLKGGMLDGAATPPLDAKTLDAAEGPVGGALDRRRVLVTGEDDSGSPLLASARAEPQNRFIARHTVKLAGVHDDGSDSTFIEYRVAKGLDRESGLRVMLRAHHDAVAVAAERMAKALGRDDAVVKAVSLAGRLHDMGKDRHVWQRYANNWDAATGMLRDGEPIAKSDRYGHWKQLAGYRHEFGSLHDAASNDALKTIEQASPDMRDLVLHLIAAHHGWGRPHFEPRHFDPGDLDKPRPTNDNERLAVETMQRFARLQQRYGRWGLAWLESILRCADAEASEPPTPAANGAGTAGKREGTQGGAS